METVITYCPEVIINHLNPHLSYKDVVKMQRVSKSCCVFTIDNVVPPRIELPNICEYTYFMDNEKYNPFCLDIDEYPIWYKNELHMNVQWPDWEHDIIITYNRSNNEKPYTIYVFQNLATCYEYDRQCYSSGSDEDHEGYTLSIPISQHDIHSLLHRLDTYVTPWDYRLNSDFLCEKPMKEYMLQSITVYGKTYQVPASRNARDNYRLKMKLFDPYFRILFSNSSYTCQIYAALLQGKEVDIVPSLWGIYPRDMENLKQFSNFYNLKLTILDQVEVKQYDILSLGYINSLPDEIQMIIDKYHPDLNYPHDVEDGKYECSNGIYIWRPYTEKEIIDKKIANYNADRSSYAEAVKYIDTLRGKGKLRGGTLFNCYLIFYYQRGKDEAEQLVMNEWSDTFIYYLWEENKKYYSPEFKDFLIGRGLSN